MTLGVIVRTILSNFKAKREGKPQCRIVIESAFNPERDERARSDADTLYVSIDDVIDELILPFFKPENIEHVEYALIFFLDPYSKMKTNSDMMQIIWREIRDRTDGCEIEYEDGETYVYDYDTHKDMRFGFEYFEESLADSCNSLYMKLNPGKGSPHKLAEFDYSEFIDEHWDELITEEFDARFEKRFMDAIAKLIEVKRRKYLELKDELDELDSLISLH